MNIATTIMIQTTHGWKETKAWIVVPGLAVHEEHRNPFFFNITHIRSGGIVLKGARTPEAAMSAALALGRMTDWEREADDVIADMVGRRDEVRAMAKEKGMILGSDDKHAPTIQDPNLDDCGD